MASDNTQLQAIRETASRALAQIRTNEAQGYAAWCRSMLNEVRAAGRTTAAENLGRDLATAEAHIVLLSQPTR